MSEKNETNDSQLKKRKHYDVENITIPSYYSQLNPVFEQLVASIDNNKQLTEAIELLEKLTFKNIGQRRSAGNNDGSEVGTTFLGDQHKKKRKESRQKFMYEKKH